MQWHPDKHEGEEKKKAEKMFYDIAAAKEVLSDKGGYLDIINCTCIVITGVIIIENIISIQLKVIANTYNDYIIITRMWY